jgi:hypothetical protein
MHKESESERIASAKALLISLWCGFLSGKMHLTLLHFFAARKKVLSKRKRSSVPLQMGN